jgi:hypothetical protein
MSILSLAIGLMPLVDNFAHVGGFVGGLFCGLFLLIEDTRIARQMARESFAQSSFGGGGGGSDRPCCTYECW